VIPGCTACGTPLPHAALVGGAPVPCARCASPVVATLFPAILRPPAEGSAGEVVQADGESSCFYHPRKRAVRPCDACGRFLCALCDMELNERHLCPPCLESGARTGKVRDIERERVRYDRLALTLAGLPMLIFYFTILTAPIALYVALRYWKAPPSLVERTRPRLVLAILLATLQIAGWVVVFALIFREIRQAA
jgi:hypothetical protein